MNKKAIFRGYFQSLAIFLMGVGLLVLGTFFLSDQDVTELGPVISFFLWLSLFAGGFSAGINARRSGYLHGAYVGILWWFTGSLFFWLFLPGDTLSYGLVQRAVCDVLVGILGGLCGVNYLILKRQEGKDILFKMFKN
ncbi:TIGR04086 family membrane protein [Candidatus Formimonas warabiya]|uniref:TIGR04086 family membrane protein n=1 Tax=Formimonas warabiya TaxID=1761012 RepID=A0A3G1KSU9_FORW1|nr:TIGR04086 family membrane protein [Candidatus Formimonas warabiya]ATW25500.1 hypothetical protein DCMF_12595 [Candidatus Formimonas warabiya]